MKNKSFREKIYDYVKNNYGCEIEHLWFRFPGYAVFRRRDSGKWFGIIMDIKASKFGIDRVEYVDVLNVKISDFIYRDLLLQQNGIFKGYHMGHNWISVLLTGSVSFEQICELIDLSYESVGGKIKGKKE